MKLYAYAPSRVSWTLTGVSALIAFAIYWIRPPGLTFVAGFIAAGVAYGLIRDPTPVVVVRGWKTPSLAGVTMLALAYAGYRVNGTSGGFQAFAFVILGMCLAPDRASRSLERRLQRAIEDGQTGLAKLLVDQGADINRTIDGETALGWAVVRGNIDVARYLLEQGADVDQTTDEGNLIGTAEYCRNRLSSYDSARPYNELIALLEKRMAAGPSAIVHD